MEKNFGHLNGYLLLKVLSKLWIFKKSRVKVSNLKDFFFKPIVDSKVQLGIVFSL